MEHRSGVWRITTIALGALVVLVGTSLLLGHKNHEQKQAEWQQRLDTANMQSAFPLLAETSVVTHGYDHSSLQRAITAATYDLVHFIGSINVIQKPDFPETVTRGKVVFLGQEGDAYVGFTTACTAFLDAPWPSKIPKIDRANSVFCIVDPENENNWDYYGDRGYGKCTDKACKCAPPYLMQKTNAQVFWKQILESQNQVRVERIGENDAALVYFYPSNVKGNFFADGKIKHMGLDNPSAAAKAAVGNATRIFGQQFFLYCERCHLLIQKVPEMIEGAYAKGYKTGYAKGLTALPKLILGTIVSLASGGLVDLWSEDRAELAQFVKGNLGELLVGEMLLPATREVVPTLRDFIPERTSRHDIDRLVGMAREGKLSLAGINDHSLNPTALDDLLRSARDILLMPDARQGGRRFHILADGRYINQLLVALGLASPDVHGLFPFRKEFLDSEDFAKGRKAGMWRTSEKAK